MWAPTLKNLRHSETQIGVNVTWVVVTGVLNFRSKSQIFS